MPLDVVSTNLHVQHRCIKPSSQVIQASSMTTGEFAIITSEGIHQGHLVFKKCESGCFCLNDGNGWRLGDSITVALLKSGDAFSIVVK